MKKIFKRFIDVWKPSFFQELSTTEKTLKTTIWFWVLTNFLIASVFVVVFLIFGFIARIGLPEAISEFSRENNITDKMGISMQNGELSVQDIDEPIVSKENDFLFILDTKTEQYDNPEIFGDYKEGFVILKNKAYFKEKDKMGFATVVYKEESIPDFSFNFGVVKNLIENYFWLVIVIGAFVVGLFVFLWFAVFRLLTALWWALILFILAMIFGLEKTYGKSYEAVLNFYFIPLVIETILFFTGLSFGFSTLIIFSIIFIVNLVWIKDSVEKKEII